MKRPIFTLLLLAGSCAAVHAQDTLYKTNGYKVTAEITLVTPYEVVYHKPEWQPRRVKRLSKSEIAAISYADGRKDTFFIVGDKNITATAAILSMKADKLYELGKRDAATYYSRYEGAATGTLLATFPGSPAAGLLTAIATSATPPKYKNLQFPNEALAADADYRAGYRKKAWAVKRAKVWTGWGVGVGLTAVFYYVITSLQQSAHTR